MIGLPVRLYDKRRDLMLYFPTLGPLFNEKGQITGVGTLVQAIPGEPQTPNPSEYVVMQATGLVDTGKRLIFNGDICDVDIDMAFGEGTLPPLLVRTRGVMVYDADEAGFVLQTVSGRHRDFMLNTITHVGDIFSTPDLAKKV